MLWSSRTRIEKLLLALLLTLSFAGCDGGLFGTGGDSISDSGDIADTPSEMIDPIEGPVDEADSDGGGVAPTIEPEAGESPAASRPLNNSEATTSRDEAILQVVNYSDSEITIVPQSIAEDAIAPLTASDALSVSTDTTSIDIETSSGERLVLFQPVSLATNSATAILVRPNLDVLAFPIRTRADSDETVLIRAFLAGLIPEQSTTGEINLLPAGNLPGSGEVILPSLDDENLVSDYVVANAGTFLLRSMFTDTVQLNLIAGSSYSLILDPTNSENPLSILIDSDLD